MSEYTPFDAKKILVTGGCGFIGSHLVDLLIQHGHQVIILDNLSTGKKENCHPEATLVEGDVKDAALVSQLMAQVSACFHLAAVASVERSTQAWAQTHQDNLTGTIHIFEAAVKHGKVPVVYASSAAVYGDSEQLPLEELNVGRMLSPYAADKYSCELHAQAGACIHQLKSTGCRFFNVYGPRQDPKSPYSGVISIFLDKILNRKPVTIHGDGQQSRDFIYVADIVVMLYQAMKTNEKTPRIFNFCTQTQTTVLEIARQLQIAAQIEVEVKHGPERAGDIRHSQGSAKQLHQQLKIQAKVPLSEGLAALVAYEKSLS